MEMSTFEVLRPAFQILVLAAIVTALTVRYAQCGGDQEDDGEPRPTRGSGCDRGSVLERCDDLNSRATDMTRISLSLERSNSFYTADELGLLDRPAGTRQPQGPRLI